MNSKQDEVEEHGGCREFGRAAGDPQEPLDQFIKEPVKAQENRASMTIKKGH